MVNPNKFPGPAPEQDNGAHGPLARFAAKVAIGLTLASAGTASMESTALASPDIHPGNVPEQPAPAAKRSLNTLAHVKVGNQLKTLDGATTYLVVHAGATAYHKTKSGIRKEKLTEDAAITSGLYASQDGKPVVSYTVTKSAHTTEQYSLPLGGRNTRYIEKNVYDNEYTGHLEPFKLSDISYSKKRVDFVHKGVAYKASNPKESSAQHVNGRWVTPLARGYESDEPVRSASERTHSASPGVRGQP